MGWFTHEPTEEEQALATPGAQPNSGWTEAKLQVWDAKNALVDKLDDLLGR